MRTFLLIFSLVFLVSCFNNGDCVITSTNKVKIALQKIQDGASKRTTFLKVQETHDLDTLDIGILENIEMTSFELPLNPGRDSTSFLFFTKDSLSFHLTLGYATYTRVIAADCGAFLFFRNLSVKDSNFDSTRVTNPQLLISVNKNLEVFF